MRKGHSKSTSLDRLRRWVPLAVRVIVNVVILAIPMRILQYGFLPRDDALRYAAQAVNGKPWSEIVVLDPFYTLDPEFGWPVFPRGVFSGAIAKPARRSLQKWICPRPANWSRLRRNSLRPSR